MKKVFIVHGFKSTPNSGWKSWLMVRLSNLGYYACSLPMPTPSHPKKDEWSDMIKYVTQNQEDEIFLVGHSLGVLGILNFIQRDIPSNISGCILVSGPYKKLHEDDISHAVRVADNFYEKGFDFELIKSKVKNFVIIHGDDDPKVPYDHAEFLEKNLNGKLITVKNGKHLSAREGFIELPEVLTALENIMI